MSFLRLALRSIVYYRRMHAGLLVGTALACGILTGALLVGESVDGTLRAIAGARLGRVAFAMDRTSRPVEDWLADNLRQCEPGLDVAAVLRLPGMLGLPPERRDERDQLNRVQVLGVDGEFFKLAKDAAPFRLRPQEVALNEKAARALEVKAGDDLVLRVMRPNRMPLDAPLAARKDEPAAVSLVTVAAVVSDEQLGGFSLAANQAAPYNVFADRKWLQDLIGEPGLANLLLAGGEVGAAEAQRAVEAAWDLEQIGLRLREHASGLLQLESDYVFIDEEAVRAALDTPGARPTLTYLVNSIAHEGRSTPYSFVQAGATPADMPDNHAVVSQWLAEQLQIAAGDEFEMAYFTLRADNTFAEEKRSFVAHSVVAMEELAVERELAPQFPGLSDVESCSDWNIGMPMDDEMLKDAANEAYWREYRQTPKLLVTYEAGRRMWGNQFGEVTAVRFPSGNKREEMAYRLREKIRPQKVGLAFTPVGLIAEQAVAQSMDFGGLFLGMSFFLIAAALILLGLLYVFGLQQRAAEFATLGALGFTPARIRAVFLLESAPTALAGSAIGAAGGAAYARLLLAGLARFWPAAVAGTPVEFYAGAGTMAAGGAAGLVCAMVVITVALWRFSRRSAHELLSTDLAAEPARLRRPALGLAGPTAALLPAIGLGLNVWLAQPRSYALHFFGAGALVLIALIGYGRWVLLRLDARHSFARPRVWKLALVNLTRRPGRTLSVAGLTACGCFLVFAVSSMRENVALHAGDRNSGTGGFALFAETTIPLTGTPAEVAAKLGSGAVPLRVRDGDDAGCLNLNRAQQPRMFGVNAETMAGLGAFDGGIWQALQQDFPDGAVPALIGDSDTAMWGLQKKVGDELAYRDGAGREVTLRIAGVLPMRLSVFQGSLLVSDAAFTRLFPSESGFRAILIDADGDTSELARRLNRDLEQYGMQAVPAVERLREFYGVESSYLAMFLVLGGLGLVLGAGGVGVVVLRNGFERRAEFALLHAVGFEWGVLFRILLAENAALAAAGIGIGVAAAAVAIVPIAVFSQTAVSVSLQGALLGLIAVSNFASVTLATLLSIPKDPAQQLRNE